MYNFKIFDSVSPDRQCFFVTKQPVELRMGQWGCEFAFYTRTGKMIYYRRHSFALQLDALNPPINTLCRWTLDGAMAAFVESGKSRPVCLVILDVKESVCYRLGQPYEKIESLVDYSIETDKLRSLLHTSGIAPEICPTDLHPKRKWYHFFPQDSWLTPPTVG